MSPSPDESSGDSGDRAPDIGIDREKTDFAPAKLEPGLRREFLLQAALLNGGVLALGAGLVLLAFSHELTGGIVLTGLGALLLGLATWRYRREAPPE